MEIKEFLYKSLGSTALASVTALGYTKARLTRETLDFINRERYKGGSAPLLDIPRGLRFNDTGDDPVSQGVGRNMTNEIADSDFDLYPVFLWLCLFDLGFYSRYNLVRPNNTKRKMDGMLNQRERYLRLVALLSYLRDRYA